MSNRAFNEVQAMIDDRYGLDSPESIAVKEAFRVYLAWLDAPEVTLENVYAGDCSWFGMFGLSSADERKLENRQVRLVEVK